MGSRSNRIVACFCLGGYHGRSSWMVKLHEFAGGPQVATLRRIMFTLVLGISLSECSLAGDGSYVLRGNERTLEAVLKAYSGDSACAVLPACRAMGEDAEDAATAHRGRRPSRGHAGRQHRQRHEPVRMGLRRRAAASSLHDREGHVRARLHRVLVVQRGRTRAEVRARSSSRTSSSSAASARATISIRSGR